MAKGKSEVRVLPGATSVILHPLSAQREQMERAGLIHGGPGGVRFATGRRDAAAPVLDPRRVNCGVAGKQR